MSLRSLSLVFLAVVFSSPAHGAKWNICGYGGVRRCCQIPLTSCRCRWVDPPCYCLQDLDFKFLKNGQWYGMYESHTYFYGCSDPNPDDQEDDLYVCPWPVNDLPEDCEHSNCHHDAYWGSGGVCCAGHKPLWTRTQASQFIDPGLNPAALEHCFYRIPCYRTGLCRPVYVLIVTLPAPAGSSESPRYFGVETRPLLPPMDPARFPNNARVGPGAQLTIDYTVAGENRHAHIWLER
jgi:hypothetical protein